MSRRLLIRPGAIGDFLLCLPALEYLRAEFTEVWCAEQNVPLAMFADRARSIGSTGLDRVGVLPAQDVLERLGGFDEIHSWYGGSRPDFRESLNQLPIRFYDALPRAAGMHATEFFCREVGAPVSPPRLPIVSMCRGFSVIHPFASSPEKRWPLTHFGHLARLLGDVQWCAGPTEPLEPAVRIGDLGDLARWLAGARVFIGNDSGITHLAAAAGAPVVALFGPTDPEVWAPRASHVRVLSRMPLEALSPEEVLAAAQSLI